MEYLVVDHVDQLDCKGVVVPLEVVVYMGFPIRCLTMWISWRWWLCCRRHWLQLNWLSGCSSHCSYYTFRLSTSSGTENGLLSMISTASMVKGTSGMTEAGTKYNHRHYENSQSNYKGNHASNTERISCKQ